MANNFAVSGTVGAVTTDKVTKLVVLVADRRKDRDTSEWLTAEMPVSVTCFGQSASIASRLSRGQRVVVLGRVSGREYQGRVYDDLIAGDIFADGAGEGAAPNPDDIPF